MKVDVKVIITIATLLVPLVGFYYTTNLRLDTLETEIAAIKSDIKQVKKQTKKRKVKK
mgnify:CR=1 FL=1|jgi:hypothetical protein